MVMEINRRFELSWLPEEIWVTIFETYQLHGFEIDDDEKRQERSRLDTLLNISSTCKGFYHLVRPILYRTLDFHIHKDCARLALLIDTLVEDPDVWQYVRQVRLPTYNSLTSVSGLELETGAAGKEKSRLLVHLEGLGISPDLIHDIAQDSLNLVNRGDVTAAILLCLCRNLRAVDIGGGWRSARKATDLLLRRTLSERDCTPTLAASQARPKLLLDRRPCAEITSIRVHRGRSVEMEDLAAFLGLPSLLSFNISDLRAPSSRDAHYKHLTPVPSWNLQHLKIENCAMSACVVVDVVRACRSLRSLDIDVRHEPSRPPFRYDHLGEHLMGRSRKLEVLICRDYKVSNRVAFLDGKSDSLRPLTTLRTLGLPLSILWNLRREKNPSFEGVLPTSLEELRIFSASRRRPDLEYYSYALPFSELMRSQQYPVLTCIRIEENEVYDENIPIEVEAISHGWEVGWDMETREHVYTRSINDTQASV